MIPVLQALFIGVFALQCYAIEVSSGNGAEVHTWLLNNPRDFHNRSAHLGDGLVSVLNDKDQMKDFEQIVEHFLPRVDGFTDGEVVDALEHFFWGQKHGLAIELGALDGSANTKSQTVEYEKSLGWRRILVEGDPTYKENLLKQSYNAFFASAAICSHQAHVHFSDQTYTGGILEFMSTEFFHSYHTKIYNAGNPPGDLKSVDWSKFPHVKEVDCIPLSTVLHKARARHVNYFILDVEGAELEVLNSINWSLVKFDVLCIETDPPNRPPGYAEKVALFMTIKGYKDYAGQVGRNMWFVRPDFVPSARPGLAKDCYNGARKSDHAEKWWANRKTPAFQACPLAPTSPS